MIAAPPLLHFDAAQQAFRPYWAPMAIAVVIMLAGVLRAVAPLDVPWLRTVTVGLSAALVVGGFLFRAGVDSVVQINQILVGAAIAVVSLVVAIVAGDWLG